MRYCFGLWIAVGLSHAVLAQPQVYWNPVYLPGANGRIMAMAADPRDDSILYVAASGGGIWKTKDGGKTWAPLSDSAPSLQVCSLALDPRFPDVVYLGTGDDQSPRPAQGIARSADGGQSWIFLARFTSRPVCTLAVDPMDSGRLYAGSAEGLFLSTDAGATWNKVLTYQVTSVAFGDQGSVYAGMLGGEGARKEMLARSNDGGRTWIQLPLPPNPNIIQANWVRVLADAATVSLIVSYQLSPLPPGSASSAQSPLSQLDFYRSTDAGNTWSTPSAIGRARPPVSLFADASGGRLYVAGATLLTSANQGYSWQTIPTTTGEFHAAAFTGGMLLLGGERGLEPGALFQGAPTHEVSQLPLGQFLGVSIDSMNGVWGAGTAGLLGPGPFYRSIIDSRVPGVGAVGNVTAAAGGSTNIFASGNSKIYCSTDGGLHFSPRTVLPDEELRAPFPPLVFDPVSPTIAYAAGRRVYRTSNSGTSWTALAIVDPDPTHVIVALAIAPGSRTVLYAATACLPEAALVSCPAASMLWRSTSGGQSWVRLSSVSGLVNRLAVDPRLSNTVYGAIGAFPGGPSISAGFVPGDLLMSADGGATWASVRGNLPQVPINAIVIDPTSLPSQITRPAQRLYVGTDAGVFASFNAGAQWTDIRGSAGWSLPMSPVTDLSLRQPAGTLLAATFGRGVYSTSTTGLGATLIARSLSVDVTLMQGTTVTTGIPLTNASTATTFGWRMSALDSWISIPEPSGSLRPGASSQVAIRISAAGLKAGFYLGRLQLISGNSVQNILVETNVTAPPAQMTIVSGNDATGAAGTDLPPLKVLVSDADRRPLPGIPVNFTISKGGGSLSAGAVLTNAAGIASTILTLPANRASIQVLATSGDLSVTFTVTSIPVPTLQPDSVSDGVSFRGYTSPGPGSILSISGQNLAEAAAVAQSSLLPTLLRTTRVLLSSAGGDLWLPLFSVSPLLVKALLPPDLSPGAYRLCVEVASIRSKDVQISVAAYSPGIFTVNEDGRGPGIFIKTDGTQATAANPAERGATVTFYAAGLGAVNPPVGPGQPGAAAEPLNRTVKSPRVYFDSSQGRVIYSGLVPGVAGRYQVTVRIPTLLSRATNVAVSLTIGGFASNRVTIPVR